MNFRRECVQGEKFDEKFTGYSYREDADFSYRVFLKRPLHMIPEARLYHRQSPHGRLDSARLREQSFKNYFHIFKKYKNKNFFSKLLFSYSLFGIIVMDFFEMIFSLSKPKTEKFQSAVMTATRLLLRRNS
jgi:GT2 family glycosyltransferase